MAGDSEPTERQLDPLEKRPTATTRMSLEHAPSLAVLLAVVLILTRRFFSSDIPAGADAFGLMSRSAVSVRSGILSAWSPIGFGAPRTFTLDQFLVLANAVTRNPVTTYKLMVGFLLTAAAGFTYVLTWRWFHSRFAAGLAGTFYILSPLPISQLTSGHLNIAIVIALLPLQLLLWDSALERFEVRTAIALGLTFGALLLVRPDMVVLGASTSGLYFVAALLAGGRRGLWRNAFLTTAVASVVAVFLDAYQAVPALAGARASWASGQTLFTSQQLLDHSLPALQSLGGLSQETGYLGYMNLPFAYGHPWLSYSVYIALALLPFVLAVGLLRWRRDSKVTSLIFVGLCATFLAKGTRGPVGGIYAFAIHTAHPLTNFRDPDRWSAIQALAFSVLAAVAIAIVARLGTRSRALSRFSANRLIRLPVGVLVAVALAPATVLVALVVLPSMPMLVHGLATYRLPSSQTGLLHTIKADKSEFITATAPYGASYRFVDSGTYRGYEQDLGTDSSIFTGHQAIGDGTWGGRGPAFITYTHALLDRGDPAFVPLLAVNNVKYVASLNYPALPVHYTTSGSGEPNLAPQPFADQRALSSLSSLTRVTSNGAGVVFAVPAASPIVSASSNIAAVFGGYSALAEMADTPGIDLRDWASVTAGDALDSGGLTQLQDLVNESQLVYIGDTAVDDVALASLGPIARLPGILSGLLPTQPATALASTGQLTTRSDNDSIIRSSSSSIEVTAPGPVELWVRAQSSPVPGMIAATVDGRRVGDLLPLSVTSAGFRWTRVWHGSLSAGRHTFRISSAASDLGVYSNVTQALVVRPTVRAQAESRVRALLDSAATRTMYASDPSITGNTTTESALQSGASALPSPGAQPFWTLLDPNHTQLSTTTGPNTEPAVDVRSSGGRKYFAVTQHRFKDPQDWSGHGYFFFQFHGVGNGKTYEINVFDDNSQRMSYTFVDSRSGWRTLGFSIPNRATSTAYLLPADSDFNWGRVTVLKLSTPSKSSAVAIGLGDISLSHALSSTSVRLDVSPGGGFAPPTIVSSSSTPCPQPALRRPSSDATTYDVTVPTAFADLHCRIVLGPESALHAAPSPSTRVTKTGRTSYAIQVSTSSRAVLEFARSFDPGWKLSGSGVVSSRHLAIFGLQNGYVLDAGTYSLRLTYRPDRAVLPGLLASLFVLTAATLALVILTIRPSRGALRRRTVSVRRRRRSRLVDRLRVLGWAVTIALVVVGGPALMSGNTRVGEWALLTACLIAPVGWRVHWAIAFATAAEAVLLSSRGQAHLADVMAVAAELTALRAAVTLLLSSGPVPTHVRTKRIASHRRAMLDDEDLLPRSLTGS